ncbi:hypothetical protein DPEC_G00225190 [Dallia pectoralis]|uniref:Uncharacterized protein n=1 Tax=Dallia pectoralis TaxID=75939 RepID=A0ACC2G0F3_DALPE|nr:hypothetical protein DPEC_G00225190 [Dallia pectoralis]
MILCLLCSPILLRHPGKGAGTRKKVSLGEFNWDGISINGKTFHSNRQIGIFSCHSASIQLTLLTNVSNCFLRKGNPIFFIQKPGDELTNAVIFNLGTVVVV